LGKNAPGFGGSFRNIDCNFCILTNRKKILARGQKNWYYLVAKAAIECKIRTADRPHHTEPRAVREAGMGSRTEKGD
jgi:hypothetical protein